jgi:glycosyltransferase involved in cell wall biosynthesis
VTARVRVVLDGTPLLGQRTGVGRYVEGLVAGLAALAEPPELGLVGFSRSGSRPGVGAPWVGPRVPARLLHALWRRGPVPPVEWLTGPAEVFHATNFWLPPLRRAAGVVTVHDLSFLLHADTVTPAVLRYREHVPTAVARAGAVITVSEAVRAEVVEHLGVPAERVHAVPLGVSPQWSAAAPPDPGTRTALGLPADYLLFVGTLEPRKGLATLMDVLRLLQARGQDVPPLVLAGPAGWGPPVDGSGLSPGSVVRLGWVDDAQLRQVVAGATALVLPSRYEGFGLPPLEAFACGTPVVASDLPVLREVSGPLASYAPVGDAEAFAEAVLRVLDDDGGPDARLARRDRAAGFTWERCAQRTLAVYRQSCS